MGYFGVKSAKVLREQMGTGGLPLLSPSCVTPIHLLSGAASEYVRPTGSVER